TALMGEPVIGLDVETTLTTSTVCLIQIAGSHATFLIDPLDIPELAALSRLLLNRSTTKIIHHATFERQVLGRHGLTIEPVVDTLEESRSLRGDADGFGHSLRAVC